MTELTEAQKASVTQRAKQDAAAHRSGWPRANACPFFKVDEATLWRKIFDLEMKGQK